MGEDVMTLDLTRLGSAMLRVVFGLGPQVARPCTYVRAMGRSGVTGLDAASEIVAVCLALVGRWSLPQWSPATLAAGSERLIVRASELAAVAAPGGGDFLVETASGVVWRIVAGVLECEGQFWVFQGERRGDEYWGDLVGAVAAVEDRGELLGAVPVEGEVDPGGVTACENWLGIV
jgi:hypothetical protein